MPLKIEVYSDVICPWCYLGRHRLGKALEALEASGPRPEVQVVWRAFELNPGMPRAGNSRREYRTRKFGSWERSQALDARVAGAAAAEGLPLRLDRIERTPNTFDAHRLIALAGREGAQDAVVARLFRAYFAEGMDVGEAEVLVRLAGEAGLDPRRAAAFLASDQGADEVRREETEAQRLGIDSVPTFVLNGHSALPGAQPPDVLLAAIRSAR